MYVCVSMYIHIYVYIVYMCVHVLCVDNNIVACYITLCCIILYNTLY